MTLTELLPALQNLPRPEKLRAMQFLLSELAREEELTLIPDTTDEIGSPFGSHEAAEQLTTRLETDRSTSQRDRPPRQGWSEQFARAAAQDPDLDREWLDAPLTDWDNTEWEW